MKSFIEIHNLSKIYKMGKVEFSALKNVNISIRQGDNVAIVGKSGSGKSTLLNMITGIDIPTSGSIKVSDQEISNLNQKALTQWRGQNVGIVFQFFQLLPTISILDNLVLVMDFVGKIPKKERKKRAIELLKMTGIESHANKYPSELSGGEQQRAAISRALVNNPEIIIADEPTGNLDSMNTEIVNNIFAKLNAQGKTILTVTHEQINPNNFDKVFQLSDGKIAAI